MLEKIKSSSLDWLRMNFKNTYSWFIFHNSQKTPIVGHSYAPKNQDPLCGIKLQQKAFPKRRVVNNRILHGLFGVV